MRIGKIGSGHRYETFWPLHGRMSTRQPRVHEEHYEVPEQAFDKPYAHTTRPKIGQLVEYSIRCVTAGSHEHMKQ